MNRLVAECPIHVVDGRGLRRHSATSAHRAAYQPEFVAKLVLPRQLFAFSLLGRNRPGSSQKVVGRGRKGGLTLAKLSISIHQSYERTRSSVLVLYHRAEDQSGEGELLGIPPDSSFRKPPWPKPRPKPSSP